MNEAAVAPHLKLVRMVNQISDFFAGQTGGHAAANVCDHLVAFWTPKMRNEIIAHLDAGGVGLSPLSTQAVELLRQKR